MTEKVGRVQKLYFFYKVITKKSKLSLLELGELEWKVKVQCAGLIPGVPTLSVKVQIV
jgi:hypothetical protein